MTDDDGTILNIAEIHRLTEYQRGTHASFCKRGPKTCVVCLLIEYIRLQDSKIKRLKGELQRAQ